MTLDEKFLQAVLIRPPKVLGMQLAPYCAGHALLLDALSNAFVTPDADWSIEDLGIAVLVCSRSFEQGRALLVPRGRGDRISLRARWLLWRLGRRARRKLNTIEHEMQTFAEYLLDYQEMPDYWDEKSSGLKAPWPFAAVCGVVIAMKGALSLSDAWNLPLSESVFYSATVGDLYGDEGLMSQRDKEGLKAAREGRNVRRKTEDGRLKTEDGGDAAGSDTLKQDAPHSDALQGNVGQGDAAGRSVDHSSPTGDETTFLRNAATSEYVVEDLGVKDA